MAFFIVFSPEGTTPPVRQHDTHKEAMGTAHMMAARHPGQSFYVMKSASRPVCADVSPAIEANEGGDDVDSSAVRAVPDKDNSDKDRANADADPPAMARSNG